MPWKTLDDMELAGKVVLTRVDINVPMEGGAVSDMTRIDKIKPTVDAIVAKGGKVVPEMSLGHLVAALSASLGREVVFAADCVGDVAAKAIAGAGAGDVVLLENTRFKPGEEKNDPALAAEMAALGDVYVNDAFSAAHRAHASTEGMARLLPAAAGLLMEAELKALEAALGNPKRPVVAVVGGAKVSTKIELLANLVTKVDHLVIGGGMANTFLVAEGIEVGRSLAEREMAETAREIHRKAQKAGCAIHLPIDVVVAREFKAGAESQTVGVRDCPPDAMILDAGPKTVASIEAVFAGANTLIWNGPLGAFEIEPFDAATNAAAKAAARLTREGKLISVAGGGDTVAALNQAGAAADFTFISTAGGAFLEWMEGKELPGVADLMG